MKLHNQNPYNWKNMVSFIILVSMLTTIISLSHAAPFGPTVTYNSSEQAIPQSAAELNTSGGSITTMNLNATAQNIRWKAYVGNITQALTLDNINNQTVFSWNLENIIGELYATRSSATINWTNVNCTWSYNGTSTVRDVEEVENRAINHTNPDDNISATFTNQEHSSFFVGAREILADTCYSIHTYVNDAAQSVSFEEVLLYDGSNETNGNLIYGSVFEENVTGFDGQEYDFQVIVPDSGLASWTSSITYYFYVELT